MCDLVGNPEDRFSHDEAHIETSEIIILLRQRKNKGADQHALFFANANGRISHDMA